MEERYNATVAFLLTIFIVLFMVIGAAVQVIVVARFFHSFYDVSYEMGAVIGTAIVLLYSLFGGFKGVVLTDLLQFIFFLITGILLCYMMYDQSGGLAAVEQHAIANDRARYTSFFSGVSDNLAYVITFGTSWMIQANIWQRISAARKPMDAKKMMIISFFAFIPLYLMVTYTGMFASVLYDSVPSGGIVPDMIRQISHPVLSATLFVGLSAAIMSTMDSLINTGALSLTVDIYKRYINVDASQERLVLIGRVTTLMIGCVALLIALQIQSVLTISWIASDFLTTGAFIPLVLGFVWKRGTSRAATCSMVFGLIFSSYNLLAALGLPFPIYWEVASAKQAIIGILLSLIIYMSVSLLEKPDSQKAEAFITRAGMLGEN
jgi:SSS family solute:Na+ symporter